MELDRASRDGHTRVPAAPKRSETAVSPGNIRERPTTYFGCWGGPSGSQPGGQAGPDTLMDLQPADEHRQHVMLPGPWGSWFSYFRPGVVPACMNRLCASQAAKSRANKKVSM